MEPARAAVYWKKSNEYALVMEAAAERGAWNAAGSAAVHAAISAADALAVRHLGLRSRDPDHASTVILLRRLPVPDADRRADAFEEIVLVKNLVEYEDRLMEEREARRLLKRVDRFRAWAAKHLPALADR